MKQLRKTSGRTLLALIVLLCATTISVGAPPKVAEPQLSPDELKSLDRFEEHTLSKADQTYGKKQYRQARAEYDSFIVEFPRSALIPYALLRKGRASQLDEKRFRAVADYKEIIDYFPNNSKYASAALYYIGECHELNGDTTKAIKSWGKLAEDKQYRTQPLGAVAIIQLADYLTANEKADQAVKHYRQVAVDFRKDNPGASRHACEAAILYYVRTNPGGPEYRKFYQEMGRFGYRRKDIVGDLTKDQHYWSTLRSYIRLHGVFATSQDDQATLAKSYYAYWAEQMRGKFAGDMEYGDGFYIERANYRLAASGDKTEWITLLDQQHARHAKRGTWKRTVHWMSLYAGHPEKVEQYYRKLAIATLGKDGIPAAMRALWKTPETQPLARKLIEKVPFGELSNNDLAALALHFYEKDQKLTARFISKIDFAKMPPVSIADLAQRFTIVDKTLGRSVLNKTRWADVDDKQIAQTARRFWQRDRELVKQICLRMKDRAYGQSELMRFYEHPWGWNPAEGLPLADQLIKSEKYSAAAWWAKGRFHQSLRQPTKAIAAYQNCQNAPVNLWKIAECQMAIGKVEAARRTGS